MYYYDQEIDHDDAAWYNIPGHPNHQVSLRGHVRHKKKHNILKPHIDKDGYYRMSLGSVNNVPIHRIACLAIYGEPPEGKTQVNHRDSNRENNHFLNLEWATPSENIKHGVDHGDIDPMKGLKKAVEANLKSVRIVETGETFESVKKCAEHFGVNPNRISRVLTGSRKGQRLHGCHFEYAEKEVI